MTVYDRPNPGLATETNKLTLHIRPRGFEPLTYGFVGGFAAYVQTCTEAYALGLAWVSAYHSRMSVPSGQARLAGESPQKSPQSNCIDPELAISGRPKLSPGKFRRMLEGGGGVNRGVRDSWSPFWVPENCPQFPEGPSGG